MTNYDRIARFYDVDMARNMPFDDVAFYAQRVAEGGGRALELGCGNGRILLPLQAAGHDVFGVDASAGMLSELLRKGAAVGTQASVCRMDVRALAFRRAFATVLCPYSLVTYLPGPADFARMAGAIAQVLVPGGQLVIDAFVPRPVAQNASTSPEFKLDYRRAFGDGELERWKRITRLSETHNRIERRYLEYDQQGQLRHRVDIAETIRPYAPQALVSALEANGFAVDATWWDYGVAASEATAQFFAVRARVRPGE